MKRGLLIIAAALIMGCGEIKEKPSYKLYEAITVVSNRPDVYENDTLFQVGLYGINDSSDMNVISKDYNHLAYLNEWERVERLETYMIVNGSFIPSAKDTTFHYTEDDIIYMFDFLNDSTRFETIFIPVEL